MKHIWVWTSLALLAVGAALGAGCTKKAGPDAGRSGQAATRPAPSTATANTPPDPAPTTAPASPESDAMREKFGVEVVEVAVRGPAIEVMLAILMPEKAGPVLSPGAERYLLDQKTGTKLAVPTSVRRPGQGRPTAARRSFSLSFDNSRGLVKPQDKVTLIVGDLRLTDLKVN